MPIEVIMPQMGESIAEGTLVRWLKNIGERVQRDEPLFEISTDKVDTEIPSPADGVLQEIRVKEGETVPVQTVVALLAAENEGPSKEPRETATAAAANEEIKFQEKAAGGEALSKEPRETAASLAATVETGREVRMRIASSSSAPAATVSAEERLRQRSSPLVRRIAREHGIDLRQIRGTGSAGRVTKKDILAFIKDRKEAKPVAPGVEEPAVLEAPAPVVSLPDYPDKDVKVEALSIMRQKIAEHMVASKRTSPHVTTVFEVDMTEVARKIEKFRENFLQLNGVKLTYLPFIMKTVISGLREYPLLNATLVDDKIHYLRRIHLGVAVALEGGLIVPVVKDADEKSIVGLARAVRDLADRARSKKLQPEEVHGGTFTLTNHGVFGSLFATPIINQPQVAILGVGAVTKRPVVLPGTDAIAVRSMMYLSLSFDHRLIDGVTADKFLAHIKDILERCPYSPMES